MAIERRDDFDVSKSSQKVSRDAQNSLRAFIMVSRRIVNRRMCFLVYCHMNDDCLLSFFCR